MNMNAMDYWKFLKSRRGLMIVIAALLLLLIGLVLFYSPTYTMTYESPTVKTSALLDRGERTDQYSIKPEGGFVIVEKEFKVESLLDGCNRRVRGYWLKESDTEAVLAVSTVADRKASAKCRTKTTITYSVKFDLALSRWVAYLLP